MSRRARTRLRRFGEGVGGLRSRRYGFAGVSVICRRSMTAAPGLVFGVTVSVCRPGFVEREGADVAGLERLEAAGVLHGERELLAADGEFHLAPAAPLAAALQHLDGERRRASSASNSQRAVSSLRTQKPSVFLCGSGSNRSITPDTSAVRACSVIVPSAACGFGA